MSLQTREQIIEHIKENLQDNPNVFAFWLEGADVHNTVDEYSDIDIWLDVKDDHEEIILKELEKILSQIAPLDFSHEVDHPHPKIRQKFFHLKDTPKFLIIDVCIQRHSREFWYTEGYKDEKAKIIFDKDNVIEFRDLDKNKLQKDLEDRTQELKKTFTFFQAWIEKEINRQNFLEAMWYYDSFIMEPLVELLRIKYEPTKKDFYLKHITKDLPADVVEQLNDLCKLNSLEEISQKSQKANEIFQETLKDLEKENS